MRTLVTLASGGLIAEYTLTGEKVWELTKKANHCYFAQRLDKGNTLFADENGLHIVDAAKT